MVSVSFDQTVTPFSLDQTASEYPPGQTLTNTRPAYSSFNPAHTTLKSPAGTNEPVTKGANKLLSISLGCGAAGLLLTFTVFLLVTRRVLGKRSRRRSTSPNPSLSVIDLHMSMPASVLKYDTQGKESDCAHNEICSLPNIPPEVILPIVTPEPELKFRSDNTLNRLCQSDDGSHLGSIQSSGPCYRSRYARPVMARDASLNKKELGALSKSVDSGFSEQSLNYNATLEKLQQLSKECVGDQTLTQALVEDFCSRIKIEDLIVGYCYHISMDFSLSLVDEQGGSITFSADNKFLLSIPHAAIDKPTLIYAFCEYDVNDIYLMTPIVNCGPDQLTFKIPASLTIAHCSTDHELLEAVNQQTTDDDWSVNDVIKRDEQTITMLVPHFTRFGARIPSSRIPIMNKNKTSRVIGKRLVMIVYREKQKLRAYFANDLPTTIKRVEKNEIIFPSRPLSPWKPFLFYLNLGGLKVSIQPGKTVKYRDETVLAHQYDYCEQSMSEPAPYTVTICQPDDPSQLYKITHEQSETYFHYIQPISTQTYNSQPTNNSTLSHSQSKNHPHLRPNNLSAQRLSTSRVPTEQYDPSLYREPYPITEAEESCICQNACNCVDFQNCSAGQSPAHTFSRSKPCRVSKDSGYDSSAISPDQPLPLHCPSSIPTHNEDISLDGLTLTTDDYNTVSDDTQ